MQKATCDECEKEFTIKLRTKDHGISIKESYFACSNCKKKYIAFVTDPECRKMQREIAKIREEKNSIAKIFLNAHGHMSESEYRDKIQMNDTRIKTIQAILEPRMNKLKAMYS